MKPKVRVAVVRASTRREAVSGALALIASELRECVAPETLIKPNLVSHKRQLPSTHVETFTVALDAVLAAGAREVIVAEGASDATAGFEKFGFRQAASGRPARFIDLNKDENDWEPLELRGVDGSTRVARVSRTVTRAKCRVSLALAKTHVTSGLTFSLKNMLSSIHPQDRVMMHGHAGGSNGASGWKRHVVEFLKGDSLLVNSLTRLMGRVRNARSTFREWRRTDEYLFQSLRPAELSFLQSVAAMNRNLVALATATKPHLSVVDGFMGTHREGPRHGTPIKLRTVVAGTDAVAVDAVAAAVMGFDPRDFGFLVGCQAAGLGIADLDAIEVVGDPIATVRRPCIPHSNHAVQRHWRRLERADLFRGPHFNRRAVPIREVRR